MVDVLQIGFFVLSFFAYCAALWYEFYKVIRSAKNNDPQNIDATNMLTNN